MSQLIKKHIDSLPNTNLVFFILLNLSFVSLSGIGINNRTLGGVIYLSVISLCLIRLVVDYKLVVNNKAITFLVSIVVVAFIASTVSNYKQIYSTPDAVILYLSSAASLSFIFISACVFKYYKPSNCYEWPLLVFILICGIAIWEFLHFESASIVLSSTLRSGNLMNGKVSSVFTSTTEFGPYAAIISIYYTLQIMDGISRKSILVLTILLVLLACMGVVLSGSRTALLGFFVGLVAIFFVADVQLKKMLFVIFIFAVFIMHFVVIESSYVARKFGTIMPYMEKIHNKKIPDISDFKPELDFGELTEREQHWEKALSLWRDKPFLGIGLGQYNLKSNKGWKNNVHNLYLNILTEGGLLLAIPFFALILLFLKKIWNKKISVLTITLGIMALVENSYDHLLAWNMTIAWIFISSIDQGQRTDERIF